MKKSVKANKLRKFFIFSQYFPKSFSEADSLGVFPIGILTFGHGLGSYADSVISSDMVKGNKTTPGVRCHIVHT